MENNPSGPFTLTIREDGSVVIPASVLRRMGFDPGQRMSVRVTALALSEELEQRGVGEDEVDRISETQMEPRENVLKFLASEGRLKGDKAFRSRFLRIGR
ncbi:MAG: hypothetical protein A2X67_09670 [Ignavibacteria bacterium GWA2_55_11]|nr:MAG: hypothetical protein A2X67_09670 [Ignavibacteria bacterium GWA2_55_11]OGU64844.1 MAG: hypothetical protein A3C56_05490 [Ignavibacteria bacterium RIFCSPHIGHO2_02_FULL_56_12]OGU71445.1 MAG: hypothetical protein A3G43_13145 [Ignavibacteria bacterium RIFCSPLOWO2_12_FULL_56_21]OGU74448.1 MAG: hypothetical protein A3H45_11260 [Ignavibacteria bacterium RIFCSPLOWO2_02_FULL_55_14]